MRTHLLVLATMTACVGAADGGRTISLLTCEPAGGNAARLRLVVFNAGRTFQGDEAAKVRFVDASGQPVEMVAPGPRARTVPLATSKWEGDHVEVLDLGLIDLAAPCPAEIEARGGVAGEARLDRGDARRRASVGYASGEHEQRVRELRSESAETACALRTAAGSGRARPKAPTPATPAG